MLVLDLALIDGLRVDDPRKMFDSTLLVVLVAQLIYIDIGTKFCRIAQSGDIWVEAPVTGVLYQWDK